MNDFKDHLIFDFKKVSDKKGIGISIEKEGKNNEVLDDNSNSE